MWEWIALGVLGWVLIGVATAVVMIRRGHSARLWLVGGIATGPFAIVLAAIAVYLETDAAPSAVTPGQARPGPVRVLACVDGSEASDHAVVTALSLLGERVHTLTLLTVLDYDSVVDTPAERLDQRAAEIQGAAVAQVTARGVTPFTVRATGRAAEQILAHLDDTGYDLLVLSARRQPVAQLLGSVARELAEKAPVPVLIVRPATTETAQSR